MSAEEMVIGACILTPTSIRVAAEALEPHEFRSVTLAQVFKAIVSLNREGESVETYTVWKRAEELGAKGIDSTDLIRMVEAVGSGESIGFYAEQVKEAASRRGLSIVAANLMREAGDETFHPSQTAQKALEGLKDLQTGTRQRMKTKSLAEILAIEEDHDWTIKGLLERGDRLIITGFEGGGKTTWIRQLAICMAAGIHPTTLDHLPAPLNVMVIDAENSETQWRAQVRKMTATAKAYGLTDPAPGIQIMAGERFDITKDSVLGEIHRLIDQHSPDVMCIGPIYKMVSTGVNNDQEAAPLIMALDSLRERGVALIMEGHSPKGGQLNVRDLAPRGSAALMGWPEFGFGLYPDKDNPHLTHVTKWRGDREEGRDWPKELERGGPFPWTGDIVSPRNRHEAYGWEKTA